MSSDFSSEFKELVRAQTDLVALVSESVALTPLHGGREHACLCPFHDDHNPSLRIYPERQTYRCWVCNEGGDCFTWVMKIENIGFRDALESLARRANLELPQQRNRQNQGGNTGGIDRSRLYDILAWAEDEFHRFLLQGPQAEPARAYLQNRGFSPETIARFRLGYHPHDWEWLLSRARGKFSAHELLQVGLVQERKSGGSFYDCFVDRVLFPIYDRQGRPVAFGGRILPGQGDSQGPKYWNSPESELFAKSSLLYGLSHAREGIRASGSVVVVEGYTDCIIPHQHGLTNVVGTLGTALTDAHVTALKRIAPKVVLLYDGDAAGQLAAERAIAKFLAQDVDLRILTLPDGMDPADYVAKYSVDALRELIESADEAWEYKLRAEIAQVGADTVDGRRRILESMLELLSQTPRMAGSMRENMILSRLSQRLSVPETIVRQHLSEIRAKVRKGTQSSTSVKPPSSHVGNSGEVPPVELFQGRPSTYELVECELLEIVFSCPEAIHTIANEIEIREIQNRHLRQLLLVCLQIAEEGNFPSIEYLTTVVENPDLKRFAVQIDQQARQKDMSQKLRNGVHASSGVFIPDFLLDTLENLKWRREQQRHERTKGELTQRKEPRSGLNPDDKALLKQYMDFHQKRATKKSPT